MKRRLIALLTTVSLAGPPALAVEDLGAVPGDGGDTDLVLDRMDDDMQQMQRLMERALRTRDPDERRELARQHHETLRQALATLRSMRWQGGDCPSDGQQACLMERQRRMEQRLDMMQQVLEQVVQQQAIVIERMRR